MFYLILAILSSALVSITMRIGKQKVQNNMAMFTVNYLICAALSFAFMEDKAILDLSAVMGRGCGKPEGIVFAIWFGLFSGVLYLASFVLLQQNIKRNGVVISATFMKLGVLIPTLMAVLVFKEWMRIWQAAGVVLALIAIILIHFEKEESENRKWKILLIILLACSGLTDATANIFDKVGNSVWKDHYLFYTFAAAGLCAFLLWIIERQKVCLADVLSGICIGIPNYFSARFLLLALHSVPAVIVYPVYSVMTIVVISIAGVILFREKLSRQKIFAIGLIFAALILLNS